MKLAHGDCVKLGQHVGVFDASKGYCIFRSRPKVYPDHPELQRASLDEYLIGMALPPNGEGQDR